MRFVGFGRISQTAPPGLRTHASCREKDEQHIMNAQTFSSEELHRRTLERRAIEAAIWGMPIVSMHAMREAFFRDAKAKYNDIVSGRSRRIGRTRRPRLTPRLAMSISISTRNRMARSCLKFRQRSGPGCSAHCWMRGKCLSPTSGRLARTKAKVASTGSVAKFRKG
jgi:hypothetical protein